MLYNKIMKRILLTVQYDGTNYYGWQKQPNVKTIQGEIENAFFVATGQNIEVFGSGRTDAGVHALHQTAHFDLSVPISEEKIAQILNDHLPPDIVITNAKEVDGDFHARFSIKKKTYLYKIHSSKDKFAFEAYHFGFIKQPLDEEKMREVAKLLIGTHDFKGFCSSQTSATDFTRTIYDISVERVDENNINIFVTGSGFLYNMVRIIVGTMVDYSLGKVTLDQINDALGNGNRSSAGRTMPASGLYLYNTEY